MPDAGFGVEIVNTPVRVDTHPMPLPACARNWPLCFHSSGRSKTSGGGGTFTKGPGLGFESGRGWGCQLNVAVSPGWTVTSCWFEPYPGAAAETMYGPALTCAGVFP